MAVVIIQTRRERGLARESFLLSFLRDDWIRFAETEDLGEIDIQKYRFIAVVSMRRIVRWAFEGRISYRNVEDRKFVAYSYISFFVRGGTECYIYTKRKIGTYPCWHRAIYIFREHGRIIELEAKKNRSSRSYPIRGEEKRKDDIHIGSSYPLENSLACAHIYSIRFPTWTTPQYSRYFPRCIRNSPRGDRL